MPLPPGGWPDYSGLRYRPDPSRPEVRLEGRRARGVIMGEPRSVVLAGGGTGGHIYPLLAFADCLRRHQSDIRITCVGSPKGLEGQLIPAAGYELRQVPAYQLPRSISVELAKTDRKSVV